MPKPNKTQESDLHTHISHPNTRYLWILFTLALTAGMLGAGHRAALAQTREVIDLPRIDTPPVLDGRLDEPFWDRIDPLPMTLYQPVYEGEMSEESEIYVVYDDNYIYLAGKLYHDDAGDIRSNSLYRDSFSGDDTFALILDTFNDNENALWFFTNPAGTRFDVLVSNDAEGRDSNNFDWDTFWEVETYRADWGWSAEMRIPFSSLGFQVEDGQVVMGLLVYRFLSKLNERYVYPDNPPDWDNGFRKPSVAQKVRLTGIESSDPVYITPYLLGGRDLRQQLNTAETAYTSSSDWTREAGLDVKMNLTSNLTLDLTANTDFAQVEADNQQVNLSRFPLFFPEKRRFFQERSSVFNFNFSRNNRLFHSRRIGLDESGMPIRIYGGSRLVGKIGQADIGVLSMQTAPASGNPSENFSVFRTRKRVFNQYSNIGTMFTSRVGADGSYNLGYGVDGIFRLFGDEYLTLKAAQTYYDDVDPLQALRLYAVWERRINVGLSYEFEYDYSGPEFMPEVGFTTRQNFTYGKQHFRYTWLTEESETFREFWIGSFNQMYYSHDGDAVETFRLNPMAGLDTNGGTSFSLQTNISYERLFEGFVLSDREGVDVPAGEYWFQDLELRYNSPNGWKFRPELNLTTGGFYDGRKTTLNLSTRWSLSPHFEVRTAYEYNGVRFKDRGEELDTHLMRLNLRTALNTEVSFNPFIQYNSEIDKVSINARFRYNMAEGNDLWIVYDEILNSERDRMGLPRAPASEYRAILVKFTYTFKTGS